MILRLIGLGRAPEPDQAKRDLAKREEAKRLVREALALSDDDAVTISEITCPDPDCPVLETIILVMRTGEPTRAHKLHGGLDGLDPEAVRAALERGGR